MKTRGNGNIRPFPAPAAKRFPKQVVDATAQSAVCNSSIPSFSTSSMSGLPRFAQQTGARANLCRHRST